MAHPWIREHYFMSELPQLLSLRVSKNNPNGLLMLVKRHWRPHFHMWKYPETRLDRYLLVADLWEHAQTITAPTSCLILGDPKSTPQKAAEFPGTLLSTGAPPLLRVGTTHMESRDWRRRCAQLRGVVPVLEAGGVDAVMTGDFNFTDGDVREMQALREAQARTWMDTWQVIRPDATDNDSRTNVDKREGGQPRRLDRVMHCPGNLSLLQHSAICKIGTRTTPTIAGSRNFPQGTPSDHYGLLATFGLKPAHERMLCAPASASPPTAKHTSAAAAAAAACPKHCTPVPSRSNFGVAGRFSTPVQRATPGFHQTPAPANTSAAARDFIPPRYLSKYYAEHTKPQHRTRGLKSVFSSPCSMPVMQSHGSPDDSDDGGRSVCADRDSTFSKLYRSLSASQTRLSDHECEHSPMAELSARAPPALRRSLTSPSMPHPLMDGLSGVSPGPSVATPQARCGSGNSRQASRASMFCELHYSAGAYTPRGAPTSNSETGATPSLSALQLTLPPVPEAGSQESKHGRGSEDESLPLPVPSCSSLSAPLLCTQDTVMCLSQSSEEVMPACPPRTRRGTGNPVASGIRQSSNSFLFATSASCASLCLPTALEPSRGLILEDEPHRTHSPGFGCETGRRVPVRSASFHSSSPVLSIGAGGFSSFEARPRSTTGGSEAGSTSGIKRTRMGGACSAASQIDDDSPVILASRATSTQRSPLPVSVSPSPASLAGEPLAAPFGAALHLARPSQQIPSPTEVVDGSAKTTPRASSVEDIALPAGAGATKRCRLAPIKQGLAERNVNSAAPPTFPCGAAVDGPPAGPGRGRAPTAIDILQ